MKAWDMFNKTHLGLPNKVKSMVTTSGDGPEENAMNPQAEQAFNQAQAGLSKSADQIEADTMQGIDPSAKPITSEQIQSQAKPMAFGGPETAHALELISENRYKDDIQKLRIQKRGEARMQEAKNQGKAFENLIEKNKLAQQAHSRRMERKQARYAARMGAISAVMQAGGMLIGGAAGGAGAGAVGPKPGANQGAMMSGAPTTNNQGVV